MKHIKIFLFIVTAFALKAQDSVDLGPGLTDPAVIMDIVSQNKGVLIPRLSNSEIQNIGSPPDGLLVYDTTNKKFAYAQGSEWQLISASMNGSQFCIEDNDKDTKVLYGYRCA